METRANYIVTGAFTLAVIVGVFGFIFWFRNTAGGGERSSYRVVFTGSVSGLRTGSAVLFNGIRVGRVSGLGLDAHDPRKVVATISVERALPVRADTKVAITYQGLTGLAEVALTAGADVTQAARDVLSRIAGLVAENETALRSSLHNIETVSSTLAQNSQRLDKVMAGLENLTGSGDSRGEIAQAADAIGKLAENLDSVRTRSPPGSRAFLTPASRSSRPSPSMAAVRLPSSIRRSKTSISTRPGCYSGVER